MGEKYGTEIWINQKHLEKQLDIGNIADRTQYYFSEFKKMRCEVQEYGKYQPCKIFVKNTLAVEITMSAVKTEAAILSEKFGVNQHDKVLHKQQSLGLRLKNCLKWRHNRRLFCFTLQDWFYFWKTQVIG